MTLYVFWLQSVSEQHKSKQPVAAVAAVAVASFRASQLRRIGVDQLDLPADLEGPMGRWNWVELGGTACRIVIH